MDDGCKMGADGRACVNFSILIAIDGDWLYTLANDGTAAWLDVLDILLV